MLKKLFFGMLFLAVYIQSSSQLSPNKDRVPPFTILLTTGENFSYKELQKDKPVILIYFAPDCDHCRDFIKALTTGMKGFTKNTNRNGFLFPFSKTETIH